MLTRRVRGVAALLLFGAVSACSGGHGLMDEMMGSWVGSDIDEVIQRWGYPDGEKVIAGKTLLVWSDDQQLFLPSTSTTIGNASLVGNQVFSDVQTTSYGGGVTNWNCTRIVEVDQRNIVVGASWKGNNCPFLEAGPYSNWRK